MSTRKALAADMLATAQALAAHPDCPTLPDTYVDSKGEPMYHCCYCKAEVRGDVLHRHAGQGWDVDQSWPDAVRLPDLCRDANGGVLLGQLREAGALVTVGGVPASKEHALAGWYVVVDEGMQWNSEHLSLAAGKAWLAWRGTR